jgi:hypothetical protein
MIQVRAPNGDTINFPDGTTDDVMASAMAATYGGPQPQTAQPVNEPQAVQDAFAVASQRLRAPNIANRGGEPRQGELSMRNLDSIVRQLAKGAPLVGSFLDEANAVTGAALHPMLGSGAPGATFGDRYDQNVAAERARDKQFETAHPVGGAALQVAGGLASGGALLKAAPAAANLMLGNFGTALPTRIAAGAVSGAGLGAVHGFGAGEGGVENRTGEALRGGAIGGGVGGALPAVTGMAGALARALSNWRAGSQVAEQLGVPRSAVERVAKNVAGDELTPTAAAARATDIGPEGMVLDMGRQLQGRAEAIASMPGTGQNRVVNAVEDRVKSSGARVGKELDAELGQSRNIVELRDQIDQFYTSRARPAYEQVMRDHPQVWDDTLQKLTRRGSVNKAIDDAVALAQESGDEIASPFTRAADGSLRLRPNVTPNLAFWDYVKKSLDSRINALARNPDPDSAGKASLSALLDTKRQLVGHLDSLTDGAYKRARDIAADKFTTQEALETGYKIFENRMLPEQFAEHLADMGATQRHAVQAGARRALERLRETAPANMSAGGRQVYRELLQGGADGDTAQKLRMLLGDDAANRLIAAARRETGYQSTYQQVAANSRTTPRAEAIKDMQASEAPQTLTSAMNRAIAYPITAPLNAILRQGTDRTREGVADLLTRSDATRDATIQALLGLNAHRAGNADPTMRNSIAAALMAPTVQQSQRLPILEDRRPLVQAIFGGRR